MESKATLCAFLILFVVGCQQTNHYVEFYNKFPDETLIFLERHKCFGTCPAYQLFLLGNGTVYLYDNPPSTDLSVGEVNSGTIESLLREFERREFFDFNDKYRSQVTDLPAVSTGLKLGKEHKYVYNYGNQGPKSLERLENLIDEVKDNTQFTRIELTWDKCMELYSYSFFFSYFEETNWDQVARIYCDSLFGSKNIEESS